ncbi:MAG: type II toxin-antitoxin system VapC family toxin [Prevotellaceae bacterium]|jgi:predicted nucleic acid-binding protein|nr:type II toxin-antitoxin system VapC family toxin [Prevotellaceae bacterium]
MNGIDFVADTNAIIYAMEEHPALRGFISCVPAISVITEVELLGKKGIAQQEAEKIRQLISGFTIFGFSEEIKNKTIALRQQHSIAVPDAIIAATAQHYGLTLITADKGFTKLEHIIDVIILDLQRC